MIWVLKELWNVDAICLLDFRILDTLLSITYWHFYQLIYLQTQSFTIIIVYQFSFRCRSTSRERPTTSTPRWTPSTSTWSSSPTSERWILEMKKRLKNWFVILSSLCFSLVKPREQFIHHKRIQLEKL